MVPLQTAIPLRGLAACGYATDPRAEKAYDWLLAQRLDDGAWPTGMAAGNYGYVGGYRRLAHSRWGCRGTEPTRGFLTYFARFDLALVLDLCWRVGATPEDGRVAEAMAFVEEQQGPYGLWEYVPRPQASRWVTFDILRSLSRLEAGEGDWLDLEPRTPFQAYLRRSKRY